MVLLFTPLCFPVTPDLAPQEVTKFSDWGNFRLLWDTLHVTRQEESEQGSPAVQLLLDKGESQIS